MKEAQMSFQKKLYLKTHRENELAWKGDLKETFQIHLRWLSNVIAQRWGSGSWM